MSTTSAYIHARCDQSIIAAAGFLAFAICTRQREPVITLGVSAPCRYALHSTDAINVDPIRIGLNPDWIESGLNLDCIEGLYSADAPLDYSISQL